jgi:replicative DNA helicase
MSNRLPPHSSEAERGVLGGVLRDPETLDDARQCISMNDFYFDANQKIFRILTQLADENQPIDMIVVVERLRRYGWLEDVGGPDILAELWDVVHTGANVHYYSKIIRDRSLQRGLIHASYDIQREAYDSVNSAEELVAQAEQRIFALTDVSHAEESSTAWQLTKEGLERIDARRERKGPDGLATGFADLDGFIDGLKPGNLIVIGARPGCGKSALSLAIAINNSEQGIPVQFFSLEMTRSEITDRVFSMRSRVPMKLICRGRVPAGDNDRLIEAARSFATEPFILDDRNNLTASRLTSAVRRAIRRHKIKLVVVDYLQLLTPDNPRDQRHLQVGMLALRMKQLARSCNVAVLLLSQLNRESENRSDGKPKLSDLRESGDIEAHADVVLLLHPQLDSATKKPTGLNDVIIAKNRNGPMGEISLNYANLIVKFENVAIA